MKLNIEKKCAVCGTALYYTPGIDTTGNVFFVKCPCPNCHPAKVTPEYGKIIEVCEYNNYDCKRGVAYSVGARRDGMVLHASALDYACKPHGVVEKYWRYPGETEWRD